MNLFDKLVVEALNNVPDLSPLKIVVEKELLHHDILRILSQHHFLTELTFIGGTCLRTCYGSTRLSEDLDFTGGANFTRETLSTLGMTLVECLREKYSLQIKVTEPIKDKTNVDTWKVKVETRPEQRHLPAQRINIDICAVPSYERQPMVLLNPYRVEMGTSGLIVQAQSKEEIYADKLLAFALRPNRVKYRDLWDIVWLHQSGVKPRLSLLSKKLQDRKIAEDDFLSLYEERQKQLTGDERLVGEFTKEMQRFLPAKNFNEVSMQTDFWRFIAYLMGELGSQMKRAMRES